MKPTFFQSIEIHRGTFGNDGRLVFSGTPVATVSGSVFQRQRKLVTGANGEVFEITAIGFIQKGADVQRRDHLLVIAPVSGARFEVYAVPDAIDTTGTANHVGVELRDTKAF